MSKKLNEPYLRPNLSNAGTLPDGQEPLAQCPDIWCAGDTPVADFQNTLAADEYYLKASDTSYVAGHDNYFYLRLKNGSAEDVKDISAQLFYAPASLICWPSAWNPVPVENHYKGDATNSFDTVAPGAVGVVKAPFLLPSTLSVGENYCLIARIWSDKYPNPMPKELSPIYISSMLTNHLFWGQNNMAKISAGTSPTVDNAFTLAVPAESYGEGDMWILVMETENVAGRGIEVEIQNSRTDDSGQQISLAKQPADKIMLIGKFQLKKGYSSQMSIYIYLPDGYVVKGDEKFKITIAYVVNYEEYQLAKTLNLLNDKMKTEMLDALNEHGDSVGQVDGVIKVGEYTVCLKP